MLAVAQGGRKPRGKWPTVKFASFLCLPNLHWKLVIVVPSVGAANKYICSLFVLWFARNHLKNYLFLLLPNSSNYARMPSSCWDASWLSKAATKKPSKNCTASICEALHASTSQLAAGAHVRCFACFCHYSVVHLLCFCFCSASNCFVRTSQLLRDSNFLRSNILARGWRAHTKKHQFLIGLLIDKPAPAIPCIGRGAGMIF